MVDYTPDEATYPSINPPSSCRVTIAENDHPYGLFVLKSHDYKIVNGEIIVEVEERPKLSLELTVERQGRT